MLALGLVQIANDLNTRLVLFFLASARARRLTDGPQRLEEYVAQRRLAQTPHQLRVGLRIGSMVAQKRLVFLAAKELDFAKLFRLESAGRIQLAAKSEEVRGQHSLQNGELINQQPHDLSAAPKYPRSLMAFFRACRMFPIWTILFRAAAPAARRAAGRGTGCSGGGFQAGGHFVQIVQQLLEPKLIDLVHDD